jgi:hypothetical protein
MAKRGRVWSGFVKQGLVRSGTAGKTRCLVSFYDNKSKKDKVR